MNTTLTQEQIDHFRNNGFVIQENFLSPDELEYWKAAVSEAVLDRNGIKIPGRSGKTGENDGINEDADYFGNVFDQLVNLWMTNDKIKKLMLDERIGKMAAELAQVEGIRVWHDQALIKKPWSNPTAWHLDTPYWSFDHREALSIWIALDDATLENGCLFFIPGSHKETTFNDPGITKNMNAVFQQYPQFAKTKSVAAPMKAGSCSFHNGLCIHGAHANMTPGYRRAMTCAFMPDGSTYNGKQNVLPDLYVKQLNIGDILSNDDQNPLLYHQNKQQVFPA
jgi:ectoine hydroxylase-related dioxygenase (phytanoyl-CoA dioxygenase family)